MGQPGFNVFVPTLQGIELFIRNLWHTQRMIEEIVVGNFDGKVAQFRLSFLDREFLNRNGA